MSQAYVITDLTPLVAIISEVVTMLSQWLQCIMPQIHQYRMHMIYKPSPDLCIIDWLCHNGHTENEDHKIAGIRMYVNTIITLVNIPVCTSIEDIKAATYEDVHL